VSRLVAQLLGGQDKVAPVSGCQVYSTHNTATVSIRSCAYVCRNVCCTFSSSLPSFYFFVFFLGSF